MRCRVPSGWSLVALTACIVGLLTTIVRRVQRSRQPKTMLPPWVAERLRSFERMEADGPLLSRLGYVDSQGHWRLNAVPGGSGSATYVIVDDPVKLGQSAPFTDEMVDRLPPPRWRPSTRDGERDIPTVGQLMDEADRLVRRNQTSMKSVLEKLFPDLDWSDWP